MFTLLEVRNSRDSEETPQAMEQVFAALGSTGHHGGLLQRIFGPKHAPKYFSFEIVSVNTRIHLFLGVPQSALNYVESQLTAHYPKVLMTRVKDYMPHFLALPHVASQLTFMNSFYYPLKTHKEIKDLDMLASIFGQMAKLQSHEAIAVQLWVTPAGHSWQHTAAGVVFRGVPDPNNPGKSKAHPHAAIIETKTSQVGFLGGLRLVAVGPDEAHANHLLHAIAGSYGVFTMGEGNGFHLSQPLFFWKKNFEKAILERSSKFIPKNQIFGSAELASLWHPPGLALSMIKNISWGSQMTGEAPENLPIATESEEDKKSINFFARTEYKNRPATFGIKKDDRRKHLYVVGKTGTGKSTMIANMAINDMRNGEGMAVIDPHGDLCEVLLDYVPSHRINDVAYLDPSDIEHPFRLNPLEVKNQVYRELVSSGIVSIFFKLYAHSWGPRLEYILRNTILTLLYVPNATLLQVPELLANEPYRNKVVEKLTDQVLKNFWINEFSKMTPQQKSDAISPILNKVGQFLSSQTIRQIVGSPVSTIDLEDMMNQGKIILVNLSQGKLGEDSSALLGAMMITKMQLAAMNRVYIEESQRRDFYLYVDEFQNFATSSFIKILSEARKYRLNLMLANQYIGQIDEDIQKAIFGNTGSLVSFGVGASDAQILTREFGEKYKPEELVALGNYQTVMKLSIDNHTSSPFSAMTIPLPKSKNQNREKVIRSSQERYTKEIKDIPKVQMEAVVAESAHVVAQPPVPKPQSHHGNQPQNRNRPPQHRRPPVQTGKANV